MKKSKEDLQELWLFNFALESEDGEKLDYAKPYELMDVIISWAESNGCQIGGGFRPPKKGEFEGPFSYK